MILKLHYVQKIKEYAASGTKIIICILDAIQKYSLQPECLCVEMTVEMEVNRIVQNSRKADSEE